MAFVCPCMCRRGHNVEIKIVHEIERLKEQREEDNYAQMSGKAKGIWCTSPRTLAYTSTPTYMYSRTHTCSPVPDRSCRV